MRLLVVEDDVKMASLLKRGLEREGYAVDVAATGEDALWAGREFPYDAVVLDAMIPAPDGFDVCRQLREAGKWLPVIMLTARDSVDDRVRGLDAGADDYLPKPFSFAELFARLRALLRRDTGARPTVLRAGDLRLDPATRTVRRGQNAIALSAREFSLLELLLRHKGPNVLMVLRLTISPLLVRMSSP
jgi:two-component system, OmpR family, response regulator